jgi:hypothetical protein
MTGVWALPPLFPPGTLVNPVTWRCVGNSIWEGRHTGIRWLIAFAGISRNKNGDAVVASLVESSDVRIDAFDGGELISPSSTEAVRLAAVWKGTSQASSHATNNSNHPAINEPIIADALQVIVDHLQRTIYNRAQLKLIDEVMRPDGP